MQPKKLEVMAPPGQVIGYITQEWSICVPKFRIEDASGQCVLRIEVSIHFIHSNRFERIHFL